MRKTASFPAVDVRLFKKQLIAWAGNFISAVCFDYNQYSHFNPEREFLAAADEIEKMPDEKPVFDSLKLFHSIKKDWLFGFLSYDLKNEIEPNAFSKTDVRNPRVDFPSGYFFNPKHIVEIIGETVYIHSIDDPKKIYESICSTDVDDFSNYDLKEIQHRSSKEKYIENVKAIKEQIANGDLYEMNLCQEFYVENVETKAAALFNKLNETSPSPFACFVKHRSNYLMCASPERFLKKEGSRLISQPIKGTIKRIEGENDSLQKNKLLNDSKERAENVMIVDLVRNDLSKSSVPGSVEVKELFGVYTFPHVHQMISTVTATIRNDVHFTEAIKNAFPMGSMTGAPKVMAMQMIDKYETEKRGLFSGSVGFITPEGDFDFNVVIRSIFYNSETKYLSFMAGSAITIDCIAENEYDECMLKAKAIINVLSNKPD